MSEFFDHSHVFDSPEQMQEIKEKNFAEAIAIDDAWLAKAMLADSGDKLPKA